MLKDANVGAVIAVKDLQKAKEFYEGKLGLEVDEKDNGDPGGVLYKSGSSNLFVYPSEFAGTNKATAAAWNTDNIEAVVDELKSKGVEFEHYPNMPGVSLQGDVHVMGELKAVWFKDPDGSILNITSGM
jgi:catechol 2,3-dioxygenase-like lactoylglutathione lyase family enzyme